MWEIIPEGWSERKWEKWGEEEKDLEKYFESLCEVCLSSVSVQVKG